MLNTRKMKATRLLGFIAALLLAPALSANSSTSGVYINGVEMTSQQIEMYQQTVGYSLPPGQYLVYNGCIAQLGSGQVYCPHRAQGQVYSDGDDGQDYGNDVFSYGTEGDVDDGDEYDNDVSSYGNDVYGDGSDLYSDGNYTYSYGNDGDSYQGDAGTGYGYSNNSDGSWFHRGSDYSGGYSVGSDDSGCIYTPNWSNC